MKPSTFNLALLAVALAMISVPSTVLAWSIWQNKATDDSVCDLSPMTSHKLFVRTPVPEGTKNEQEIYARLALREAVKNCHDGQVLILHSDSASDFDANYFKAVADRLCQVAAVVRAPAATGREGAFEVRCPISKLDDAAGWLRGVETEKSTEALIADGAPKRARAAGSSRSATPKECGEITFSSVIGRGGHCR